MRHIGTYVMHLVLALLLALSAGCEQWVHTSDAERAKSFAPYKTATIGDKHLSTYALQRTAIIVDRLEPAEIRPEGSAILFNLPPNPRAQAGSYSHAVAIAHDGYFLTAAHCVDREPLYLVYWDGRRAQTAMPRIVAKVWNPAGDADYAVIHVDDHLENIFEMSPAEPISAGMPVVAVGCFEPIALGRHFLGFSETCMGGTITSQKALKSSMHLFAHTVPVRPGDSGGPLLDLQGRLVAINEEVVITPFQPKQNIAVMPPPEWLETALRDDRAGTHEKHEPLPARVADALPKGSVSILISLEDKMDFRVGDVVR